MTSEVSYQVRAATSSDEDFLLRLYTTTHDGLNNIDMPQAQKELLLKLQFNAQRQQYAFAYPAAEHTIVLLNNKPVGRTLVNRNGANYRLVDIALLPENRGRGLGRQLIQQLLDDARAANATVSLQVRADNPAMRLYARLGFSVCQGDGPDVVMEWRP